MENKEPTTLFPKIGGKHADFIENINYLCEQNPEYKNNTTIHLTGTVKLHGTHGDIVISPKNIVTFQSRNRTNLTPTDDNSAFAKTLTPFTPNILALKDSIIQKWKTLNPEILNNGEEEIIIAGEWIGPGIQKKVAINFLPTKVLVILAICINGTWQSNEDFRDIEDQGAGIVNVSRGGFYYHTLHIDNMEAELREMQPLADAVEEECPFGKALGVIGPGEGIVWRPSGPSTIWLQDPRFWIKTKGPISSTGGVPRIKLEMRDEVEKARAFAQSVINEMRLQQGWDYMMEMKIPREKKSVGLYMKWIWGDVEVEEKREIEDGEINRTALKKEVEYIGKKWYFEKLNNPRSE